MNPSSAFLTSRRREQQLRQYLTTRQQLSEQISHPPKSVTPGDNEAEIQKLTVLLLKQHRELKINGVVVPHLTGVGSPTQLRNALAEVDAALLSETIALRSLRWDLFNPELWIGFFLGGFLRILMHAGFEKPRAEQAIFVAIGAIFTALFYGLGGAAVTLLQTLIANAADILTALAGKG